MCKENTNAGMSIQMPIQMLYEYATHTHTNKNKNGNKQQNKQTHTHTEADRHASKNAESNKQRGRRLKLLESSIDNLDRPSQKQRTNTWQTIKITTTYNDYDQRCSKHTYTRTNIEEIKTCHKKPPTIQLENIMNSLPPPGLASLSDRRAGVTLSAQGIHINHKWWRPLSGWVATMAHTC